MALSYLWPQMADVSYGPKPQSGRAQSLYCAITHEGRNERRNKAIAPYALLFVS